MLPVPPAPARSGAGVDPRQMRRDPLIDTLFRPTTMSPEAASAPPVRAPGSHTRAGNAMARSRAALLDGARRAVLGSGTKITMSQVATAAGIAKATLYNHFRTREAVLGALVDAEVDAILRTLRDRPLEQALAAAAGAVSEHQVLRALERVEPAALVLIGRVDDGQPAWRKVTEAVAELLAEFDRRGTDTVVRWLASFVLSPATPAAIARDVEVLLAGLPPISAASVPTAVPAVSAVSA